MARFFDDAQSEYVEWSGAGPPVTSPPFTLSCWFYTDTDAVGQALMWIGDKDASDQILGSLQVDAVSGGYRKVIARTVASGGLAGAAKAWNYSVNTWHHVCGVFSAENDRLVALDYSQQGSDNTSLGVAGIDRVSIGRLGDATPDKYLSGAVAEAAIWNVALADDDVRALHQRFSPLMIRPENLAAYWPLGGLWGQNDNDRLGTYPMTAYNSPSWTDHPPLIYPGRPRLVAPISPVSPKIPWHLFQGRAA
ncbi:MAG: LamG-like jellyroll fold domain-containing protein [Planctomycetota bacterium]